MSTDIKFRLAKALAESQKKNDRDAEIKRKIDDAASAATARRASADEAWSVFAQKLNDATAMMNGHLLVQDIVLGCENLAPREGSMRCMEVTLTHSGRLTKSTVRFNLSSDGRVQPLMYTPGLVATEDLDVFNTGKDKLEDLLVKFFENYTAKRA